MKIISLFAKVMVIMTVVAPAVCQDTLSIQAADFDDYMVLLGAESFMEVAVTSADSSETIAFDVLYFNPGSDGFDFNSGPRSLKTPHQERIFDRDLIALFRKIEGSGDLIVSIEIVEKHESVQTVTTTWDVAFIQRIGNRLYATGL